MDIQKMTFSEKTADFALKLFHEVVAQQNGEQVPGQPLANTFLSPTSISVALAMTYAGAAGSTKGQMNELVFERMDDETIENQTKTLCQLLNRTADETQAKNTGYTLTLANKMFCQDGYNILETYTKFLKHNFSTEAGVLDFIRHNKEAVETINNWVSEKTAQKIKKLFEALDPDTRLVLVNAVYFKGDWANKFDPKRTAPKPFYASDHVTKQLDTMWARNKSFYFRGDDQDWSVLGLPYKNEELCMVILLPKEQHKFALNSLEKKLTGAKLWELIDSLSLNNRFEVQVELPKFKLESKADVKECLEKLGVTDMFSAGAADFSKITGNKDLNVSQIVHKAYLEVNEEGSEAAAATGVAINARCMPMIERFIANYPFLFAIIDKSSRCLLFLGHFYG